MVNITYPELKETKAPSLPPAELDTLKKLREDMCLDSSSRDFKLQVQQRFLRRVLSPESPTRCLLMVHGTGTGKTCTAIQIAEEFIIRPEFQNKKVLMLANPSVQNNFKNEIFSVDKLNQDADGLLLSKQCTGRRYLEIIQRAQSEPLRMTDQNSKIKVMNLASRILGEFYEFFGYDSFANYINSEKEKRPSGNDYDKWIHDTFDNRLIIVDEAHNLREITTESTSTKISALAIEHIVKTAKGVTLVLLTATPMFDKYDEIIYYFNLFLWNERKLDKAKQIPVAEIFTEKGDFREGQEARFRKWCEEYISYVKGDNPFTFPFRLPPPTNLVADINKTIDHFGKPITEQRKYLTLTKSIVSPFQEEIIKGIQLRTGGSSELICVYPENKSFVETFEKNGNQYGYRKGVEKFLTPSKVGFFSSKFALVMNILNKSTGLAIVYSNLVEGGARLFAMCLEEHGYENAIGESIFKSSGEVTKGSKGKYVMFTGDTSDVEIKNALLRLKARENVDGSDIRVIIASPKVSEGVDFKYVRQIHVLDPWYNMSRIEQVLGRGMRTCSHALLPFEQQNCTVYLHVCRYPRSNQECLDETIYRVYVENKAARIAKVKRVIMESAMDCDLQSSINNLPKDWRDLTIPQLRSEDQKTLNLKLVEMSAPTFEDTVTDLVCRNEPTQEDNSHIRPLSAILDIRDEVFDKLLKIFMKKQIWSLDDLYVHPMLKQYTKDVLEYLIQNAIESGFKLKDKNGRIGTLESSDNVVSLTFNDNDTMVEKIIKQEKGKLIPLPEILTTEPVVQIEEVDITAKRNLYDFPEFIRDTFDANVLDWYIVDNVLTPQERTKHFLNLDWDNPPFYAMNLRIIVNDTGKTLYVLGSKQIYNNDKVLTVPIGEEQDAYNRWITQKKDDFVNHSDELFASMKSDGIIFNVDEKSKVIQKAARSKNIGGRMCHSYPADVLNEFAKWLSSNDFPEQVKTKENRCLYLDLLVRRSVLDKKPGIFWLQPELLQIFNEDEHRKELIKRLK